MYFPSNFNLISLLSRYFFITLFFMFMAVGCASKKQYESYHKFETKTWPRFENVTFEIPINQTDFTCDIYFFVGLTNEFPYESILFNMVMNTPSGEERIREYSMPVKSDNGNFLLECNSDSCHGQLLLKEGLTIAKPGTLKIELENLIPKLEITGISGVGIRVVRSGK